MPKIIQCNNISKEIHKEDNLQVILPKCTFSIQKGDMLAITGSSGSGKSTLLNILGMLDSASTGEYIFSNKDVSSFSEEELSIIRQKSIGFIFQQYHLIKHLSVLENVQLPLQYQGKSMHDSKDQVMETLRWLNMEEKIHSYPHQLSGGQQQRVSIARSIITQPELLLADEPTGALDHINTQQIMCILQKLNDDKKTTIVLVTHDKLVASMCKDSRDLISLHSKTKIAKEVNE